MTLIRSIALAALAAGLVAGCGSSAKSSESSTAPPSASETTTGAAAASAQPPAGAAAFAWIHPGAAPPGWASVRIPSAAVLAYPATWQRIHSDPGTATAVLMDRRTGLIDEYLNVTPQQGQETLQNWPAFRPDHNKDEGDSQIKVLAAARGLRFRDGQGSCVIDRYHTARAAYQEIACLVRGPRGGNVIVAAAAPGRWAQSAPALEQAVSAFLA